MRWASGYSGSWFFIQGGTSCVIRFVLPMIFVAVFGLLAQADDSQVPSGEKRPTKIWDRTGPLGETPKRTTDAFPLSDQQNKGGWVKFDPMTDEFEGKELDRKKWFVGMEWWRGRQPALFSEKNVTVSDGKLHLTMRKEKLPPEAEKQGYKGYSSAALHTKARTAYGYFEVKAKPMNSGGSSSFWFQQDETPNWATEIDVFEIGGKAKSFERKYNMTLHVWQPPRRTNTGKLVGPGLLLGDWPTITMFTAWTGRRMLFGSTSMAF